MHEAVRMIHAYYNEIMLAQAFRGFGSEIESDEFIDKATQAEQTAERLAKHIVVQFKQELQNMPDTVKELYYE